MDTIVRVLQDCRFGFYTTINHDAKRFKSVHGANQRQEVRVSFAKCKLVVRPTFNRDIVAMTVLFDGDTTTYQQASSLTLDVATIESIVDTPKLHVAAEDKTPEKAEWLFKVRDNYTTCVLFTILSNFPTNISDNEVL